MRWKQSSLCLRAAFFKFQGLQAGVDKICLDIWTFGTFFANIILKFSFKYGY